MILSDFLEKLARDTTPAPWFAGPVQPEEDTGSPGGVSIGPFDLHEKWGRRPDYTPEAFSSHYEDTIVEAWGGEHDPAANAALIVALVNALPEIIAALRSQNK